MGPLELADLIGLDTVLFIAEVLHREFGDDKYRAPRCCATTSPRAGSGARRAAASTLRREVSTGSSEVPRPSSIGSGRGDRLGVTIHRPEKLNALNAR
jgi:hypothetical protein